MYANREEYLLDCAKNMVCGIDNMGEWQVPFGGYRLLFGTAFTKHRQLKRLILLFLLACMTGNEAWEKEKQIRKLIWATVSGRKKLWLYKTAIWYISVIVLWLGMSVSEIYWMIQSGGTVGVWQAPIGSLPLGLEQFSNMPIYEFAAILIGFRFAALLAVSGIMQGIASFLDKKWYAVLVCIAVIAVPSGFFWVMGMEESRWSCLMLLDGIFFWRNPVKYIVSFSVLTFLGGIGLLISYYRWNFCSN